MALEQILSVAGKPGLYRLVGQMKNGIIVEALEDSKRFPVHGSSKVSALEEISIYTHEEEVPLGDVFKKIHEKEGGKQALSHKSDAKEVKAYFESILPEYDPDRVYVSDMVKVVKWYNLLMEHNAYDPSEEEAEEANEEGTTEENKKEAADDKSADKPAAKKAPAKKKAAAKPKSTPKASAQSKASGAKSTPRKAGGASRGK